MGIIQNKKSDLTHNKTNKVLVSILCLTYNHEDYIRECIEGFLIQKTNFDFEVLIHDDASFDLTSSIIKEYEKNNPGIIKTIYQTKNKYSKNINLVEYNLSRAKGKYIALCEGDDYWTDPYKLQKQVDFLNNNLDYGLVYTKVKTYHQSIARFSKNSWGGESTSFDQLIEVNHIPSLTVLLKTDLIRDYFKEIKPETKNWKMGDYPIWLYASLKSKIHFHDEVTGVYRVLEESASHSTSIKKKESFILSFFEIKSFFLEYNNKRYSKDGLKDSLNLSLASNALAFNDTVKAIYYFKKIKKKTLKIRIKILINKYNFLQLFFNVIKYFKIINFK